jgi:hypothetical protein
MRCVTWLLALTSLLTLSGCEASPREKAEARLAGVDIDRVRREAARAYKDLFAGSGDGFIPLSPSKTPQCFRQFQPVRVVAHRDGFALTLASDAATDSGLYIVPIGMDHAPAASRRARFERLREGIYWYVFE